MEKFICKYCGKEFEKSSQLGGHIIRCKLNPKYEVNTEKCNNLNKNNSERKNKEYWKDKVCYCSYCNKLLHSKNSLKQHEIRCKENPNHINVVSNFIKYNEDIRNNIKQGSNQFIKAEQLGLEKPKVSKKTKEKLSNINKGKHLTIEQKRHLSKVMSSDIVQEKSIETKKKNDSFNKSSLEDLSFDLLKEKYSDTTRQYRSKEYPFNCDFYVPSLNLYIECNYCWTHGYMIYNENNEKCINKLNYWKSKTKEFYKNAIYTWTDLDVRKRNIANENNLNWIEFFTFSDFKKWINKK